MTDQSSVHLMLNAATFTTKIEVKNDVRDLFHITEESNRAKSQQRNDVEISNKDETNIATSIDSVPVSDLEDVKNPLFEP